MPETNKSSLIESPSIFEKGAIISALDPSASRARQNGNSKISNSQNHMDHENIDSELNSNIISQINIEDELSHQRVNSNMGSNIKNQ